MIFLFFKPYVALLEAKLAPFKDWEEIGNIWEISIVVQCSSAWSFADFWLVDDKVDDGDNVVDGVDVDALHRVQYLNL